MGWLDSGGFVLTMQAELASLLELARRLCETAHDIVMDIFLHVRTALSNVNLITYLHSSSVCASLACMSPPMTMTCQDVVLESWVLTRSPLTAAKKTDHKSTLR
jgi:hypothetical protein